MHCNRIRFWWVVMGITGSIQSKRVWEGNNTVLYSMVYAHKQSEIKFKAGLPRKLSDGRLCFPELSTQSQNAKKCPFWVNLRCWQMLPSHSVRDWEHSNMISNISNIIQWFPSSWIRSAPPLACTILATCSSWSAAGKGIHILEQFHSIRR